MTCPPLGHAVSSTGEGFIVFGDRHQEAGRYREVMLSWSQCDPKAAAKMIGCNSALWARSFVPKSELNPTTTSNKSISTYRIPTPFVAPARLDQWTG